jgi:UDP-N-acetylglucosamine--N-acetylmuramyl-(pentapeptide) pyrophosphoryl-undecaprenol N-acetylglucosamine transferase
MSGKEAAVLIAEKDLETQFENEFSRLFNSEEIQLQLSKNCKALGKPNATKEIVEEIENLLKETKVN